MESRAPSHVPDDISRRNTKRTGEYSEAAFLLKASAEGFGIAKPWGDSERYDFIVDSGKRLWRVQLKCTATLRARGYDVQSIYAIYGQGKVCYTADEIDVLVAYIIPKNAWYVLPVEVFVPSRSLRFYPDIECKRAKWEGYREAWDLLGGRRPGGDLRHGGSQAVSKGGLTQDGARLGRDGRERPLLHYLSFVLTGIRFGLGWGRDGRPTRLWDRSEDSASSIAPA